MLIIFKKSNGCDIYLCMSIVAPIMDPNNVDADILHEKWMTLKNSSFTFMILDVLELLRLLSHFQLIEKKFPSQTKPDKEF